MPFEPIFEDINLTQNAGVIKEQIKAECKTEVPSAVVSRILSVTARAVVSKIEANDKKALCENLYRVQKLTSGDYFLRRHVETSVEIDEAAKLSKKFYRVSSRSLLILNPRKVSITSLGEILDYYTKEPIVYYD